MVLFSPPRAESCLHPPLLGSHDRIVYGPNYNQPLQLGYVRDRVCRHLGQTSS